MRQALAGRRAPGVGDFHPGQALGIEAQRGVLEAGFGLALRRQRQPLQAIARGRFLADVVLALQLRRVDQRGQRAVLLLLALAALFVGCKSTKSAKSAGSASSSGEVRFSWEKDAPAAAEGELEAAVRQAHGGQPVLEFRVGVADAVNKSVAYRLLEPARVKPWPLGTGLAVADWMRARGLAVEFAPLPGRG